MEVLVAMFIFSLVIIATAQIFGSSIHGYRKGASMQQDLESAELALNSMAKVLRTSTIADSSSEGSGQSEVIVYDYVAGACVGYEIDSSTNRLNKKTYSTSDYNESASPPTVDCSDAASPEAMVSGVQSGSFDVVKSDGTTTPKKIGKITIYLDISEDGEHHAKMQTTVSLRDYSYVGL